MPLRIEIPFNHVQELKERASGVIEQILNLCFKNFTDAIQNHDASLIKPFNFSNHTDYSDPVVRSFYILKYFYAYFFEFLEIFQLLFKELNRININFENINIVSFGSGSLVDLIALALLVPDLTDQLSIKYFGFDAEDWEMYIENLPSNIEHRFIKGNFFEKFHEEDTFKEDGVNILIFPNSIDDAIKYYDDLKNIINDKLFVNSGLFSVITTFPKDRLQSDESTEFDKLIALLDSGFKANTMFRSRLSIKNRKTDNPDMGITADSTYPSYPNRIFQALTNANIEQLCPKYSKCMSHCLKREQKQCIEERRPIPILKYKYIKYRIEVFFNDN